MKNELEIHPTDMCCVECGFLTNTLYTTHKYDVIKVTHCEKCSNVVDKYIEYEMVIIFLDVILHKIQAYRHILFNENSQNVHQKLLVLYILFDTYLKWDELPSQHSNHKSKALFYAAMEMDFYRMFLVSFLELLVYCVCVLSLSITFCNLSLSDRRSSLSMLYRGLLISSYGRLFVVPAMIWGQAHRPVCLMLIRVFIFTSNLTALRVMTPLGYNKCGMILFMASAVQVYVSQWSLNIV